MPKWNKFAPTNIKRIYFITIFYEQKIQRNHYFHLWHNILASNINGVECIWLEIQQLISQVTEICNNKHFHIQFYKFCILWICHLIVAMSSKWQDWTDRKIASYRRQKPQPRQWVTLESTFVENPCIGLSDGEFKIFKDPKTLKVLLWQQLLEIRNRNLINSRSSEGKRYAEELVKIDA